MERRKVVKTIAIVSVLCSILSFACAKDAVPMNEKLWLEQTTLQMHDTCGYRIFKIPTLCVSKANTVMAIFEGRVGGRADETETNIVIRKSYDSGKTWTPLQVIYKEPGHNQTIGNPTPVVDYETGTIFVFFCRNNLDVLFTRSDDDGETWSKPHELSREIRNPKQTTFYAVGPCHGIQLKHGDKKGRLIIPTYAAEVGGDENKGAPTGPQKASSKSFVIYSDDHGKTWKSGETTRQVTPNTADGNECMVVELPDGSLYMTIRDNHESGYRAYTRSTDAGQSWSDIEFDENLPESICQASIIDFKTPDGQDAVMFCNPAVKNQKRKDKTPRRNLTIRVSYDGCKTWPIAKTLFLGPSAYSDLIVLPDGNFGCFYEAGHNERYDDELIFARFSYEWLTFAPYTE